MTSLIAELPKPGLKAQEQRRKAMEELMQRSRLNISSDWKWTLSEHDRIGYSNFSVFREVNPFNKREMWAVKRVEKYKAGFGQSKDWILREISSAALLTQEKSTYFVKFFGWTEDNLNVYLTMEYIQQGDLDKHLKAMENRWTEDEIKAMSKQLLCGLEMMHNQEIIHRDLKPANIFLVRRYPVHVKIGDFGISKRVPRDSSTRGETSVGTFAYRAPETWSDDYNLPVDLWSLGCIIYRVITGKQLFNGVEPRKWVDEWIIKQLGAIAPENLTPSGVDIMKRLICMEPNFRVTAKDALRHPWIIPVPDEEEILERQSGEVKITELVKVAAEVGEVGKETMVRLDRNEEDIKITPTEVATIFEHFDSGEVTIMYEMVKAAAEDGEDGKETMMHLLDRKGEDIKITPTAVATIFEEFNKDVITRLVNQKGKDIEIDWKIVNAVTKNKAIKKEVMILLLNQKGEDIKITPIAVATIFEEFDKDVITHLVNRKGKDIKIDWKIVNAVTKNKAIGKEVMILLLDQKGEDIKITPTAVATIFEEFDKDVITHLINRKGKDIEIDWKIVNAVTKKKSSKEVMMVLLNQQEEDIKITPTGVATIFEQFDKDVITQLLDRKEKDIQITKEIVKAAAENRSSGKEVMTLLLDRKEAEVKITKEVVNAATQNKESGKDVMTLLLDRKREDIHSDWLR